MAGANSNRSGRPLVRCVVVGSARGGKKCLAVRAQTGLFPKAPPMLSHSLLHYFGVAGQLRLFVVSPSAVAKVQKTMIGKLPQDVRSIAYDHSDVVLFCFPLGKDPTEACRQAWQQWGAELSVVARLRPVLLVGTMEDRLTPLEREVARSQGAELAIALQASGYIQCSAEDGSGVDRVKTEALRLGQLFGCALEVDAQKKHHWLRRRRRRTIPCQIQ